jgi:acetyl esterase/lipase
MAEAKDELHLSPIIKRRRAGLRLVASSLFFAWSLLAVLEAPVDWTWKPAIAATEWGHLLAIPCALLLLIPAWTGRTGKVGGLVALAALLLFLSPLLRAQRIAQDLPARVVAAFGEATPRDLPGAPARAAPLVTSDLMIVRSPEVELTRHVYRTVEGEALPLDLYLRKDAPAPRPVVVVVHGGSWSSGDPTQLPAINRYLAARGYGVAAIGYRLAPRFPFPAAHEDVLAALEWLDDHGDDLGLDPSKIVLMGRSAGGHLALLAAYAGKVRAVKGVIAYYAPTDLVWSWEHPSNPRVFDSPGVQRAFLGGAPAEQTERYAQGSPLAFVDRRSPPTLLIHGGRDELVFHEQSVRLDLKLQEAGVRHLLLSLPWATHGCDANLAGPSGQLATYAIERFLAATLR